MVDFAYRHGINYFDTAWFYHDGKSEAFIGQALQKYPRDTVYLADKMPTPILTGLDQAKDIFQTQLDRCQVAYFDNYMLHSLTSQDQFDELTSKTASWTTFARKSPGATSAAWAFPSTVTCPSFIISWTSMIGISA